MASKKKNVEERIQARKAFVASNPNLSPAEARKRFYVQTRAQELSAAGKTVDRKALRQKFESGGVTREGFYTPADIQRAASRNAASTSASSAKLPGASTTSRSDNTSRTTVRPSAGGPVAPGMLSIRRKPVEGFKSGNVQKSSVAPKTNRGTNPVESAALRLTDPKEWSKAVTGTGKSWVNAGKKILGFASSQGESLNATFVNPAINTVGRAVGKNPNLRQATGAEALLNTADMVATVYSGGVAKGLVKPVGGALLGRLANRSRTVRTVQKTVTALKGEAKLWSKADDLGRSVSAQVRGADYVRPIAPGKRTAVNEAAESTTTKVAGKKAATPRPDGKYKIGGMSDAAEDAKIAKLSRAEKKLPSGKSPVAKKATTKKAAPVKAAAPAKKAPAQKKAATPRSAQVAAPEKPNLTTTFKNQEDFDKFMDVQGGGEQMRNLARTNPQAAESFQRNNAKYIRTRQTRRTVAENQRLAAQAKRQAEINARNAETKKKLGLK